MNPKGNPNGRTKGALMKVPTKRYWMELAEEQAETIAIMAERIRTLQEDVKATPEYAEAMRMVREAQEEAEYWHREADEDFERLQEARKAAGDVVPSSIYWKAQEELRDAKAEAIRWQRAYYQMVNGPEKPITPPKLERGRPLAVGCKERAEQIWGEYIREGMSYGQLAKKYNVSKTTIMNIVKECTGEKQGNRYT